MGGSQVEATLHELATKATLNPQDATLLAGVRACLHRCNFVNRVYARVYALRDDHYDSANERHEALLEHLWGNLKPNVRRSGGRITKEWGEIGFQGASRHPSGCCSE